MDASDCTNKSWPARWTMGERMGHRWVVVCAQDCMVNMSLQNFYQVYGPTTHTILKLKVLHRVVDVFVSFGRHLLHQLFS
jgi:hypothetical protein